MKTELLEKFKKDNRAYELLEKKGCNPVGCGFRHCVYVNDKEYPSFVVAADTLFPNWDKQENTNKLKDLLEDRLMISERQFEREVGINRQTIRNIRYDKVKPSKLTVKKICAYFGVDYHDYI